MSRAARPADHVRARTTDARIDRQWAAIEDAGLPGAPRHRRPSWIVAGGGALAAALATAWLLGRAPESLPPGALVESARAEVAVQLDDGSRVELAPESQLRLLENHAQSIALELRSGSARFRVKHDRARRFEVHAGALDVRVVGTRFELMRKVQRDGTLVALSVSEGVVEVRRRDRSGGGAQRIRAGERWSALVPEGAPALAAQKVGTAIENAARDGVPTGVREDEALAAEPRATEASLPADVRTADGDLVGDAPVQPEARARPDAPPPVDASAVFRRATLARRAGRMDEAAEAYAELLARHPGDPRAGLSAFELGRIRMDAQDDPAGAIQALERALSEGGSGASFHEDALARIVVANDALGRPEACRAARARYLARYPKGVHAHALAARCN